MARRGDNLLMAFDRESGKAQILARPDRHRGAKSAPRWVSASGLTVVPAGPGSAAIAGSPLGGEHRLVQGIRN